MLERQQLSDKTPGHTERQTKILLLLVAAIFLATFLSAPLLAGGIFWDTANGLGLVAMAGLLYMTIATGPGIDGHIHRLLGYLVLGFALAHAAWLLLGDPVVLEYLKPDAPWYMIAGLASLLLLIVLIIIALPRVRRHLHDRFSRFRIWHRAMALLTIFAAAGHIAGSGYYLASWYETALFIVLVAVVCLFQRRLSAVVQLSPRAPRVFLSVATAALGVFVLIRNLPL